MNNSYDTIISVENLCKAWREFVRGKKNKKDVAEFSLNLSKNIFDLHLDLKNKTYTHRKYIKFYINDPKPRTIHKATVRDRLLHRAIYRVFYKKFDRKFIYDSYSCRNDKGTHRALNRFRVFSQKTSKNYTKIGWVLKCDVKKFFANIDHYILFRILNSCIKNKNTIWLLGKVVESFHIETGKGLPLGNLTSQLFANIYLNQLDQIIKHRLKVKYYIRYADDFVIFLTDKNQLTLFLRYIVRYLRKRLHLILHPNKIFLKTLASGVDFLGWVHFPNHRVLRTSTKRRMLRKLATNPKKEVTDSYLGLLKHGNTHKLENIIRGFLI